MASLLAFLSVLLEEDGKPLLDKSLDDKLLLLDGLMLRKLLEDKLLVFGGQLLCSPLDDGLLADGLVLRKLLALELRLLVDGISLSVDLDFRSLRRERLSPSSGSKLLGVDRLLVEVGFLLSPSADILLGVDKVLGVLVEMGVFLPSSVDKLLGVDKLLLGVLGVLVEVGF